MATGAVDLWTQKRRAPICWHATPPVLLRLALDGGAAYVAFVIINATMASWPFIAQVAVAALSGPTFLRAQVFSVGRDDKQIHFGPALLFDFLFERLDDKINVINEDHFAECIDHELLPRTRKLLSLSDLEDLASNFFVAKTLSNKDAIVAAIRNGNPGDLAENGAKNEWRRFVISTICDAGGISYIKRALTHRLTAWDSGNPSQQPAPEPPSDRPKGRPKVE